jgi:NADH-quinone oxidoreductase subunit A
MLFPFIVSFYNINSTGLYSMLFFLFVLTIGFVYEWQKGALD